MLKFLLFAGIGCVGLIVAVAFYAAWKITKMGQAMGRGGVGGGGVSTNRHDDYITTTGSTVHDWQNQHSNSSNDDSPSSSLSYSAGESIGSDIGSSATDFGSSDSGSSDSGSSDSGSSSSSD